MIDTRWLRAAAAAGLAALALAVTSARGGVDRPSGGTSMVALVNPALVAAPVGAGAPHAAPATTAADASGEPSRLGPALWVGPVVGISGLIGLAFSFVRIRPRP